MSDVNALLNERLGRREKSAKMVALAQKSASGNLTGFAGIFALSNLSERETQSLQGILQRYATTSVDIEVDLQALVSITAEVRAITNQAAILHGERIARAHDILTHYRDGAFTAWLITTYGNRQTPYNLWHYYQFHQATPKELRQQLEAMPRQAVYTLASREGKFEAKQKIVQEYSGQTKHQILKQIRHQFPLGHRDQRADRPGEAFIRTLKQLHASLQTERRRLTAGERKEIVELLGIMMELVR